MCIAYPESIVQILTSDNICKTESFLHTLSADERASHLSIKLFEHCTAGVVVSLWLYARQSRAHNG